MTVLAAFGWIIHNFRLIVGLIKIALAFLLVPKLGYVAAGALLSFYYIASVGIMAWRGWGEIRHQEQKT